MLWGSRAAEDDGPARAGGTQTALRAPGADRLGVSPRPSKGHPQPFIVTGTRVASGSWWWVCIHTGTCVAGVVAFYFYKPKIYVGLPDLLSNPDHSPCLRPPHSFSEAQTRVPAKLSSSLLVAHPSPLICPDAGTQFTRASQQVFCDGTSRVLGGTDPQSVGQDW